MILPKPLKKWIKVFRGDVAPGLILLSAFCGTWFGMTPGFQGIHMLLLIIVLIVNVNLGIFVLSAALGKAIGLAAAPLLYHLGRFVQESGGALLELIASIPVIAITDTSRYSVAGSIIAGPILGLVLGLLLAMSVGRFRSMWLKMEAESEAIQRWRKRSLVRFLDRLLIGKSTGDISDILSRRPRYVRLAGVILSILILAGSAAALAFVPREFIASRVGQLLTSANGAQVDLGSLEIALGEGRVSANDVAATDPDAPARNRIAFDTMRADLSLWALSLGRLVMDEVKVDSVVFDTPRSSPGQVVGTKKPVDQAEEDFDSASYDVPLADVATLDTYLRRGSDLRKWLADVRDYLPARDPAPPAAPEAPPHRYLEYWTKRAMRTPTPRIVISNLVLDGVDVPVELFGSSRVHCLNLSDAPRAAHLPLTVEIESKDDQSELRITSRYDRPSPMAEIEGSFDAINLAELGDELSPGNAVKISGGSAAATVSGTVSKEAIDLTVALRITDLQAAGGRAGVFGLDSSTASQAIGALSSIETSIRIIGPTSRPRIVFDQSGIGESLKRALVDAGKAELARRLDDELGGKLPEGVPDAGAILDDPTAAAGSLLDGAAKGDLLEKKNDEKDKKRDEKKEGLGKLLGNLKDGAKKKK